MKSEILIIFFILFLILPCTIIYFFLTVLYTYIIYLFFWYFLEIQVFFRVLFVLGNCVFLVLEHYGIV
jgi:hypothetical protein